jgi:hypothetical protein
MAGVGFGICREECQAMTWDIFLSYASEDKSFAAPLAEQLLQKGVAVWFDDRELKPGSRISRSIDEGLKNSKAGVVILSEAYFNKGWTKWELDALIHKHISEGTRVIPVYHGLSGDEVRKFSITLGDLKALNSDFSLESIATEIAAIIKSDYRLKPSQLVHLVRTSVKYNSIENSLSQIVRNASKKNELFRLVETTTGNIHEWGSGGYCEDRIKLTDSGGNDYFVLLLKRAWGTTSDDSMDYAYPTQIELMAVRPLLEPVISDCVSVITKHIASEIPIESPRN